MDTLRARSIAFFAILVPAIAFGQLGGGGPGGVSPEAGEPFPWEPGIQISPYSIANLFNGNVLTAIELVEPLDTVGEPFRIVLYHNSAGTSGSITPPAGSLFPLGEGWSITYGGCIIEDSANNKAYLVEDTGLMKEFTLSGGTYTPQTGVRDRLELDSTDPNNPVWVVTRKNEHKRIFNADGLLIEVRDSNLQHAGLPAPMFRDPTSGLLTNMRTYPEYSSSDIFEWWFDYTTGGSANSIFVGKCGPGGLAWIRKFDFTLDSNDRVERIEWYREIVSDGNGGTEPTHISITYDSAGRIASISDKNGNVYSYAYDSLGRISTVTDPTPFTSQTQTFAYSNHTGGAWKTQYKDRANKTWTYITNSWGGLKEIWNPSPLNSQKRYFTYDSSYNRTSFKNELNQQWDATYDSVGNLLTLTNPLGQKTAFTYDTANQLNNLLTVTPAADNSGSGNTAKRVELDYADMYGSPPQYADKTRVTSITEPADGQGNAAASTSLAWDHGGLVWDQAPGRIQQVTDAEGVTTSFAYSTTGLKSSIQRTEGTGAYKIDEFFNYGCNGIDHGNAGPQSGGGYAQFIDYESDGCGTGLSTVALPNSSSCPGSYCFGGCLGYDADPPPPTAEPYAWPLLSLECCLEVNPPSCSVIGDECARGCMDGMYQLVRFREPHSSMLGAGSTNQAIDISDRTDEMSYDELGRLRSWRNVSSIPVQTTASTDPPPSYGPGIDRTFEIVPTANGLTDTITDADLTVTDFDYDAASRLNAITVTTNGGSPITIVSFTLDAAGRPSAASYVNGTSTTWTYTAAGQVDVITHKLGSTVLLALDYNYTPDGLIDQIDQTIGSTTWTMEYDYDNRNRLIAEYGQLAPTDPAGSPPASQPTSVDREYTYDQVGNRLTESDGVAGTTTAYHYDVHDANWNQSGHALTRANRLLASVKTLNSNSSVVEKVWYLYNAAGHVKRIAKHNPGEDPTLYKLLCLDYDRNQMLWLARGYEVTIDEETTCTDATFAREFRYDANGRRRYWSRERVPGTLAIPSGTEGDGWREYLGQSIYADLDVDPATGASVVRRQYVRASDGRLIGWREGSNWHIVHADHLGSTRLVTGPSGSLAAGYGYSAFGELLAAAVPGGTSATSRYGYCGGWGYENDLMGDDGTSGGGAAAEWAGEFGLLHVGARYYSPEIGRFVQRDPKGIYGAINVYLYAGCRPVGLIDPTGFETVPSLLTTVGVNAILGGIVGGAATAAAQAVKGEFDGWELAGSFTAGAIMGAAGGWASSLKKGLGSIAVCTAGGVAGGTAGGAIQGHEGWRLVADGGIGLVFGLLGGIGGLSDEAKDMLAIQLLSFDVGIAQSWEW